MEIQLKVRRKMPQSHSLDELKEVVFAIPYEEKVEIKTTTRDLTVDLLELVAEFLKAKHHYQVVVVRGVGSEPDSDGNYISMFYVVGKGHEGKLSRPTTAY